MEKYLEPTKDWLRVSLFRLRVLYWEPCSALCWVTYWESYWVLSLASKRGCLRVIYWVTVHC